MKAIKVKVKPVLPPKFKVGDLVHAKPRIAAYPVFLRLSNSQMPLHRRQDVGRKLGIVTRIRPSSSSTLVVCEVVFFALGSKQAYLLFENELNRAPAIILE